ncbi:hypothetical protein D1007_34949 [Hordeum vulgare]|nr:hypothetical protein D1007_34949 [Hordeum vulgare]
MAEHHAILEFIEDKTEVKANRVLIPQKQAKADALFEELDAEIATEEAAAEQRTGRSCNCRASMYPTPMECGAVTLPAYV